MHTVIQTPIFVDDAKRLGLSAGEIDGIVYTVAAAPESGAIIPGTGGARKQRHAGRGHGKSGGYRTIHYFGGENVPVFLLTVYGKGTKANLSKAERNELANLLPRIVSAYRGNTEQKGPKS